jgi:hyperpolarization activated cyclic nucleotide-gated potassium channel 2
VVGLIATGAFLADVLINFNTGFYRAGDLINDRQQIAFEYLRFWFWWDLIASFPFDIILLPYYNDSESEDTSDETRIEKIAKYCRALALIRIVKIPRILMKWEDFVPS